MFKKLMVIFLACLTVAVFLSSCNEENTQDEQPAEGIDIDLTVMSDTIVYSQVYAMMVSPSDYRGSTIKAEGTFRSEYYEATKTTYNFIIINDATGCCPQGIEFAPISEDIELPDDGELIELTGVFDLYEEGNNSYYRINADAITF